MWEREVPAGSGVTGLWRPVPPASNDTSRLAQMMRGEAIVFTLRQDGSNLTGTVEGAGRSFSGGSDVPAPIAEGKVDGDRVSFKVGNGTYSGTVKGDRIELERAMEPRPEISTEPKDGLGSWATAGWNRSFEGSDLPHAAEYSDGFASGAAVAASHEFALASVTSIDPINSRMGSLKISGSGRVCMTSLTRPRPTASFVA